MLGQVRTRLAAAAAVMATMLAITAWPAGAHAAAERAEDVKVTSTDVLVFAGGGGSGLIIVSFGDRTATVKLDINLADVADFVELIPPSVDGWRCETSGTTLHCEQSDAEVTAGFFYQAYGKDSGVPPGHSGSVHVTATVDGQTAEASSTITMAESVDLATADTTGSGAPAAPAGLQSRVRNVGTPTVSGAVVTLEPEEFVDYRGTFSNCTDFQLFIVCTFDQDLAPGKTYRFAEGVPVRVDPRSRTGAVLTAFVDWWTAADWDRVDEFWKENAGVEGVPGTGAPLTLVEVGATAQGAPQTDPQIYDNFALFRLTVTGDHPADLAARGASGSGAAGSTVALSLKVDNLGPADLHDGHLLEEPLVYVSVPQGTTAVEVPWLCAPFTTLEDWNPDDEGGTPGADEYACRGDSIPAGHHAIYPFGFRVDEVITDVSGTFRVDLAGDPNDANDTAKVVINPTDGDGHGGLPDTGASLGPVIAAGGLLLAVGIVVLMLTRRRRAPAVQG